MEAAAHPVTDIAPVHVVGGGWAGIAAAVELAQRRIPVTLMEASRQLGGRARCVSFNGERVDNGQHLMIGAYRDTLRLLAHIHAPDAPPLLRRPLELCLLNANYRFELSAPPLPAPLHLLAALLRARGLGIAQRIGALRCCAAFARSGFKLEQDLSVAALLERHGQSAHAIECLWEPLCLATLNTAITQASAEVFLTVLRDAFTHAHADSDLLFAQTDLGSLVADRAVDFIETHGGEVLLGERVTRLCITDGAISALETGVKLRPATRVILATPAFATQRLIQFEPALRDVSVALETIEYEPICTVYLRYGAKTMLGRPMVGLTGTLTQWLFDRAHCEQPGVMAAVISARGAHMNLDNETLTRRVTEEIRAHFPHWPASRESFVMREKRATFSCRVGINARRPAAQTPVQGLWLAGDYTATGYPATLEGAVRSGHHAARCAMGGSAR